MYPETLSRLIECFKKLPGIGEKTAERLSLSVLSLDENIIDVFKDSLDSVKTKIRRCDVCNNISESDLCVICSNNLRDKSTICVVEDSRKVFMLEKTGSYNGLYHVLGGLISPIDDINPEDINISSLINKRIDESLEEIIIALNSSIEGETTSLYLQKVLKDKDVSVSRLSYGIPLGSDIEYIDPLIIEKAIDDRKKVE